jgi:hypothetical protein
LWAYVFAQCFARLQNDRWARSQAIPPAKGLLRCSRLAGSAGDRADRRELSEAICGAEKSAPRAASGRYGATLSEQIQRFGGLLQTLDALEPERGLGGEHTRETEPLL